MDFPVVYIIVTLVAVVAVGVICFLLGISYRKKVSEKEISSAEEEARRIINEAIKSSESKKREALWKRRKKFCVTAASMRRK